VATARAQPLAESLHDAPAGAGAASRRSLVATALTVAVVAAAVLFARGRLAAMATELLGARPLPLIGATVCALLVPAATAGAWRSVFASRGVRLGVGEAWGCYGIGSVANTFLPGRAGDALRIELFSRRLRAHRRRWLACGVSVSVVLAQSVVFGCVLGVGAALGALPIWTIAPLLVLPAVTWGLGRFALRARRSDRVACLAAAATLTPLAWVRLLGWVAASALARLLVVVAVFDSLSIPHPAAYVFAALSGLAVGTSLTPAPGGAGLAAATMSVALVHAGVSGPAAVAASVSFHAVETAAGLLFGASGWLLLRVTGLRAGARSRSAAGTAASWVRAGSRTSARAVLARG